MSEDCHASDSDFDRCAVCEAARGNVTDPHLGDVCIECYLHLIAARNFMQNIGPIIGIGPCQKGIRQ